MQVPAGQDRWVTWPLGLNGLTDGWYRIEASPAPGLAWRVSSGLVPGHVGVYALSPTRRRFRHNTFAFKVAPPQSIFAAANVLTGVTRPGNGTNLWRSDPSQAMPQWLALSWSAPTTVKRVELTFSGHTWGEVHGSVNFFHCHPIVRSSIGNESP